MKRRIFVALAVSLIAVCGIGFFLNDAPDSKVSVGRDAREEEGSQRTTASGKTAGSRETKSRSRSEREARSAEVWASLQSAPAHDALQTIDKNWNVLGKERAKMHYSYVINKAMAAGKLGDPTLLEDIEQPGLRFVISSRVARTLVIEEKMDEAIAFMLAEPEVKMRVDVIGDVLTTAATPEGVAANLDALERWLEKEPAEPVRLVLWDNVHSKLSGSGEDVALIRWRETGKRLGIAGER